MSLGPSASAKVSVGASLNFRRPLGVIDKNMTQRFEAPSDFSGWSWARAQALRISTAAADLKRKAGHQKVDITVPSVWLRSGALTEQLNFLTF